MKNQTAFQSLEWVGLALCLAAGGCNASHRDSDPAATSSAPATISAKKPRAGTSAADAPPPIFVECDAGTAADALPTLEAHTIALWPPNHKFHDIAIEDCVTALDACGNPLPGHFIWASSDEPVDDIGDGHHSPDIALSADCQLVSVRSERQGPKDGRVYKLGVGFVDADGNEFEAACAVIVDHDQSGVSAADSGEKYRVTFDDPDGGFACSDEPPPPPPPTQRDAGVDGPG